MRRWRWGILLLIVLPVYAWVQMGIATGICLFLVEPDDFALVFTLDLMNPWNWSEEAGPGDWLLVPLPGLLLALSQIAFLLPAFSRRLRRGDRAGLPLKYAIASAGLAAAILTVGLYYTLGEALQLWDDEDPFLWNWMRLKGANDELWGTLIFWVQIVLGWIIWTSILLLAMRRGNPRRLHRRLAILIFAGTLIELLITIPIDIMVRRRTDCYCATGTFIALCCAVWATFWLCGPGAILILTRKRRRMWGETHCLNCGYAKGPSPGPRCPECGYDWHIKNHAGTEVPAREK